MKTTDLHVRDVLQRPLFAHARLAAGQVGLGKRVGWVHVIEIVQVAPFISRDDLILTTGLWLKQAQQDRLDYLRQLIRQEAAGLILELGTSIEEVPAEVLELAEQHGFPVIVFDHPVRFSEITQDIHSLIINRQRSHRDLAEGFSRRLQQLTLQHSDIMPVLRLLHGDTGRQIVFYSLLEADRHYPQLPPVSGGAPGLADFPFRRLEREGVLGDGKSELLLPLDSGGSLLLRPVSCYGQLLAAVGTPLPDNDGEAAAQLSPYLDAAASAIAALMLRTQFRREHDNRLQDQLIPELQEGRIASEDQARTMIGLTGRIPQDRICLSLPGQLELEERSPEDGGDRLEAALRDLAVLLRTLIRKYSLKGSVQARSGGLQFLLALEAPPAAASDRLLSSSQSLLEDIRRFGEDQLDGLALRAAAGKPRSRLLDAPLGFREAAQALEVARSVTELGPVVFYSSLGAYQLLKAIPDPQLLDRFVQDHLGAILRLEKESRLQLLETLDMYLKCFGSKHETAKRLFIHRQTLYNRMDKLTELIGEPFLEPHKRVGLEIALMAYKLQNGTALGRRLGP
ncbi:PucR family transcriptional regulator [Paenibacillus humicus]|uniref:PucR family transcriptional regulator n=1 Tax=Paenibacillus humicus TaxID=412861 RepID=UPI000FD86E1B|nr:PucR family transcriptional regulator [Paenibacillus humicus]